MFKSITNTLASWILVWHLTLGEVYLNQDVLELLEELEKEIYESRTV